MEKPLPNPKWNHVRELEMSVISPDLWPANLPLVPEFRTGSATWSIGAKKNGLTCISASRLSRDEQAVIRKLPLFGVA